jgi:hypothetical protein
VTMKDAVFWDIKIQCGQWPVGLERGPLRLLRINEELLERKSSGSGLENLRLTAVGDPPRSPRDTPLSTKADTKFRRQVAIAHSV